MTARDNLLHWNGPLMNRSTMQRPEEAEGRIYLSEILSALSFALDLTEDAVPGHALRSCLLGMRIAAELGLDEAAMRSLYYALLLKDIGCSSNAARMCQIVGGDDRAVKSGVKLVDWTRPHQPKLSTLKLLWQNVLPEGSGPERVARIAKIALTQHKNNEEMITLRCDRGASIILKLGLGKAAAEAVRHLDEHWDGSGYPERLQGEAVPLLARILNVAQHLDVFASEGTPEFAVAVLKERSGRWFDPELVRIAELLHAKGDLWVQAMASDEEARTREMVREMEPGSREWLEGDRVDTICAAFSDVVDAKSPFTYRHSMGVGEASVLIAKTLGLSAERVTFMHRAALLHDLGKLRVSNAILDKPGKLTGEEFQIVKEHPGLTAKILERVGAFRELAMVAGQHHERLDGRGYPYNLSAAELSQESRILAVADVYAALAEKRPYREALGLDEVLGIMAREVPEKLDMECFEALTYAVLKMKAS